MTSKSVVVSKLTARTSLRNQKQQVVHAALYNAAIDLFAAKGFDETTVEEVAQAAGVSRRSFFRYFSSKDDLLSQSVVSYGRELAEAVQHFPRGLSPIEVIEKTVFVGAEYNARPSTRMREAVTIAVGSRLARQAHASRMMELEDLLATSIADYFKDARPGVIQPRMLAGITLSLMSATILSWFKGEYPTLDLAARHIFDNFSKTLGQVPKNTPKAPEKKIGSAKSKSRTLAAPVKTQKSKR